MRRTGRRVATVFALLLATRGAAQRQTLDHLPEDFVDAPACGVPPPVSTFGWRMREIGSFHVLLPPAFKPAVTPGKDESPSWWRTSHQGIEVRSDSELPHPFGDDDGTQRCRATIGERDVLVFTRLLTERVDMGFWLIQPLESFDPPNEEWWRMPGQVFFASGEDASNVRLFWTVVRTALEPYPIAGTHGGAVDLDCDDRVCPVRLILERRPGGVEPYNGEYWLGGALAARIENRGRRSVTLVLPGDGSDSGMRTPLVWLEVHRGHRRLNTNRLLQFRCGNMNQLRPHEVFELPPGHGRVFDGLWLDAHVDGPGDYSVRLHYLNDPTIEWSA